jgi:hypothetical protein
MQTDGSPQYRNWCQTRRVAGWLDGVDAESNMPGARVPSKK